ncbi:MAG: DNA polymerase IV [Candidatus Binataceae bacterium]
MPMTIANSYDGTGANWERVIAHADMDAFYASVEELDNPELRGKPVIVGGSSRRGVVTSASYAARRFGVRSAMPTAQAHQLCPEGIFVPGRMTRYAEISRAVREVFEAFSPVVEPLSLDEAFLDLSGTRRLLGAPLEVGRALKRRVLERTGLVVSVGIAPVKMAAKILSDLSKPDGLLTIGPEYLREFLAPLPVERLWGVGRVTLARMQQAGILTIGDLAARDVAALRGAFGSFGAHLYELAHGRDPRPVVGAWQRKSYGEENTFERDLAVDALELKRTLIAHAEALGRRLRADQVQARTITLKLKLARPLGGGRYPLLTRSCSLTSATDDTAAIAHTAIALLERVGKDDRIRLAGIQAHNLERPDSAQLGLFDGWQAQAAKANRLNRALDQVAQRFGTTAVTRGMTEATRAAPSRRLK